MKPQVSLQSCQLHTPHSVEEVPAVSPHRNCVLAKGFSNEPISQNTKRYKAHCCRLFCAAAGVDRSYTCHIYIYPYIIIDHHISRKTEINNFDKLGSKIHFGTMYIYIQQSLIRCTLAPKSTLVTPSGMTLGTRLPRLQAWFGDSNVGPKSSRWMIWEEPQPIYIMGLHGNLMDIDGNSWT